MRIVVLTGAGLSAESGLATFRDADGLWEQHRVEDVATPQAFRRDPALVLRFYDGRRAGAATARPNAAHEALARLSRAPSVTLITQNVDSLLDRAGARDVIHMHGRLDSALCAACGHRWAAPAVMPVGTACPDCGRPTARPDIVWFGEMPYHMERIDAALSQADLFAAIGTSGNVYPAAGFVDVAGMTGAETVELNLAATAPGRFDRVIEGPASRTVPEWVASLIG
ncbi:NAD-dependent deacylase [Paracoccus sp. MC1862]|uniref:NAD-dependent deacylase n=1 Tax=Paracoccus sp. MC1862 TaxID=2760307 RepID=UPI0016021AAB|nr:NAD-dependent deacylase [Paracoccus sp. MC1862]MBB1499728.1 NAD-dependent deacylase [Paracoccus sp. MC1862]QQO45388.1 NAD-dependent deacylase [Paracoccus sp. MC1862]